MYLCCSISTYILLSATFGSWLPATLYVCQNFSDFGVSFSVISLFRVHVFVLGDQLCCQDSLYVIW